VEPDDLLCSRNARSKTPLVGRAQWKSNQAPSLKKERASLEGTCISSDAAGEGSLGHSPNPHYSRLMVRGAVAAMLERPATPVPLLRSLMAAAGPHVLCWEWSSGCRTS
jgi:hypothetical protein